MLKRLLFIGLLVTAKLFAPEITFDSGQPGQSLSEKDIAFCKQKMSGMLYLNQRKALDFSIRVLNDLFLKASPNYYLRCNRFVGDEYLFYYLNENTNDRFFLIIFSPQSVECSDVLREDFKLPEIEVYLAKDFSEESLKSIGLQVELVELGDAKVACWQVKNVEELIKKRLPQPVID